MKPFWIKVEDEDEAEFLEEALRHWSLDVKNNALNEQRSALEFDDMVNYEEAGDRLWKKFMDAMNGKQRSSSLLHRLWKWISQ